MTRLLLALLIAGTAWAQTASTERLTEPAWRQIGTTVFEASLASAATGPVERLWFDPVVSVLRVRTADGRTLETADLEQWQTAEDEIALESCPPAEAATLPEPDAKLCQSGAAVYALGQAVYRSENGGRSWTNLTDYRGASILGGGLADLAVSPYNPEEIVVAGRYGVWRSVDAGRSWHGLNETLRNLPVRRILSLPADGSGVQVEVEGIGALVWQPGEKTAWMPIQSEEPQAETELRADLEAAIGEPLAAVAGGGEYRFAGNTAGGRVWSSPDGGRNWRSFDFRGGAVKEFFVAPGNPRVVLAAVGPYAGADSPVRVLRTTNGGLFWDDLSANLPEGAASHGIAADPATGAVYVATDAGLYFTVADLLAAAPPTDWIRIGTPAPERPVRDVKLDGAGNQLFAAIDGAGVYAAMAPHRRLAPSVVNAADLRARAASPGVLLSILGARVESVQAGERSVPILAAVDAESQIQIPFDVEGDSISLEFRTGEAGAYRLGMPLVDAAPAILVDRDNTPMLIDADSGVLLDAMTPAGPGARIQILATGLGRVAPDWPVGLAAPLENPPSVVAPVRVFLDREPVESVRATLAPGYVGFYIVEFIVPDIINAGPAELYIEAAGRGSNRSRLYLEP